MLLHTDLLSFKQRIKHIGKWFSPGQCLPLTRLCSNGSTAQGVLFLLHHTDFSTVIVFLLAEKNDISYVFSIYSDIQCYSHSHCLTKHFSSHTLKINLEKKRKRKKNSILETTTPPTAKQRHWSNGSSDFQKNTKQILFYLNQHHISNRT